MSTTPNKELTPLQILDRLHESVADTLIREEEEKREFKPVKVPTFTLSLELKPKVIVSGGKYIKGGKTTTSFQLEYSTDEIREELDKQIKDQIIPHIKSRLKLSDEEVKSLEKSEPGSWSSIGLLNSLRGG